MMENELVDWLLNADTPSIPYFLLKNVIHLPADDKQILLARRAISRSGPAPAILARQTRAGSWRNDRSFYTPKYFSTHWSMMLLAELGLDRADPGFRRGAAYMLAATEKGLAPWQNVESTGVACLWGNILRYVLQAGFADVPRVEILTRKVVSDLEQDFCRCKHNQNRPCAWGVVRALWGLAAIPKQRRSRRVGKAIKQGLAFLMESRHLEKANFPFPKGGKINPIWFGLNFPLFYQADILFTLRVLGELDALDHPGAQPALDWLTRKRAKNGRWRGASPFRQRTWKTLGGSKETDRWITLFSLQVLQQAGRLPH